MTTILDVKISLPLEREYESWIATGIEDYFNGLGIPSKVWAISPFVEKNWPADLGLGFPSKLIGLQVKRPLISSSLSASLKISFDRILWDLAKPAGQSALLASMPEIYYCFPCFLNREYKKVALDHSIFWRPNLPIPNRVWYENPMAHKNPTIADNMRWGRFVEQVMSCKAGYLAVNDGMISEFFDRFRSAANENSRIALSEDGGQESARSSSILFAAIKL